MSGPRVFRIASLVFVVAACIALISSSFHEAGAQGETFPSGFGERGELVRAVESRPGGVESAPWDVYIEEADGGGLYVFYPGFTVEEFEELYLLYQELTSGDRIPPWRIRDVRIAGFAEPDAGHVEMSIQCSIATSPDATVVRIPLGFNEGVIPTQDPAVIEEAFTYNGPGEAVLMFDAERDEGYSCFIRIATEDELTALLDEMGWEDMDEMSEDVPSDETEESAEAIEPAAAGSSEEVEGNLEPEEPQENEAIQETNPPIESEAPYVLDPEILPATPESTELEVRHEIILKLLVPISSVGKGRKLSLTVPSSAASDLILDIPIDDAVADVPETSILERFFPIDAQSPENPFVASPLADVEVENENGAAPPEMGTRFLIHGIAGRFEMNWRPQAGPVVEPPPILKVEGATILARLDERLVRSEISLPVLSDGGQFDMFHIRLPIGAAWNAAPSPDYQVFEISPSDASEAESPALGVERQEGTLLEVRLPEKTSGPVTILLESRQTQSRDEVAGWFELGTANVVEAGEQSGYVAVAAEGDWIVEWGDAEGARPIGLDQLPGEFDSSGLDGGFHFYRQPCSIQAKVAQWQTRIYVKPEYLVEIEKGRITLHSHFAYTVNGRATDRLRIDLRGWSLADVGPVDVVDAEQVTLDQQDILTVPLLWGSTKQTELNLQAYRELSEDEEWTTFSLPKPIADWDQQAILAVQPADNVELASRPEEMRGLIRQVRPPVRQLAPSSETTWGQEPLFYRGFVSEAVFSADVVFHARRITTEVFSDVQLRNEGSLVVQTLTFDVAHEPIDHLIVRIPRDLDESGLLEFTLDGEDVGSLALLADAPNGSPLEENVSDSNSPQDDAASTTPDEDVVYRRLALPGARLGTYELQVRYDMEAFRLQPEMTIFRTVPLVMPGLGSLGSNRLRITVPEGVRVDLDELDSDWTEETLIESADGLRLTTGTTPSSEVRISAYLEYDDVLGTTIVDRVWLQTRIGGDRRWDRIVYRFSGTNDRFTLEIPRRIPRDLVQMLLDGLPPEVIQEDGLLHVLIPDEDTEGGEHCLDMWYYMPGIAEESEPMGFEFPILPEDVWVRRTYWQLILPETRHLISSPDEIVQEYRWNRNGWLFSRTPVMEQDELEAWCGASPSDPPPPSSNRYLFSSLGAIETCEVRTSERTHIVLLCSGIALVLGLVFVYYPKARRSGVLFSGVVFIIGAAAWNPSLTLMGAQAASLGVIASLLAGLLYRGVSRQRRWNMRRDSSGIYSDRSTAPSQPLPTKADDADDESEQGVIYPMSTSDMEQE